MKTVYIIVFYLLANPTSSLSTQFMGEDVISFGGPSQDQDTTAFNVTSNGTELNLTGNTWKAINYSYSITPNTYLKFDFKSTGQEGEVHGVQLSQYGSASDYSTRLWQVFGTQAFGIQDENNYTGSSWKTYTIHVGATTVGVVNYLGFLSDQDGAGVSPNVSYKNVQLIELSSSINGTPNPCIINTSATTCSSTITWSSNISGTELYWVDNLTNTRSLFSTNPSGTQVFSGVTSAPGIKFQLELDGNIINSTNINGEYSSIPPETPVTYGPINTIEELPPKFNWQLETYATSYTIEIVDINANNTTIINESINGQVSNYRPNYFFDINKSYKWRLSATNSAGSSLPSQYSYFNYGSSIKLSTNNGTTDQNAITDILSKLNTTFLGTLTLESGTFDVTKIDLSNYNNVIFKGQNDNSSVLEQDACNGSSCSTNPIVLIRFSSNVNVQYLNLISDGSVGGGSNSVGIWVRDSDFINIDNLSISNIYKGGAAIQNSNNITFTNSNIFDTGYKPRANASIWIYKSTFVDISNNDFIGGGNGPGGDGSIDFHNSFDITVDNNNVDSAGASPFYIVNTKRVSITNNNISDCATNVAFDIVGASEDVTATDNIIKDCIAAAGYLTPGICSSGNQPPYTYPTNPKKITIMNNVFENFGEQTNRICVDGSFPKGMLVNQDMVEGSLGDASFDFIVTGNSLIDANGNPITANQWCYWDRVIPTCETKKRKR